MIAWTPRATPLVPVAAIALGDAARALAQRLMAMTDEQLARMNGAASETMLVISGASDELPWVDGIRYFGRDADAEGILLPTHVRPTVPSGLFAQAIARAFPQAPRPLAVLDEPRIVIPIGRARPIERVSLARFGGA